MDLNIKVDDYRLNVRAAAMIIHNNKVLMHKDNNTNTYHLPGGRVEFGESSDKTVVREILEELGKEIEVTEYACTLENFFVYEGLKVHEIVFIHKAEFKLPEDKLIEDTMYNVEGRDELTYEWVKLDEIDNYNVLPVILKDILKEKILPVHRIYID